MGLEKEFASLRVTKVAAREKQKLSSNPANECEKSKTCKKRREKLNVLTTARAIGERNEATQSVGK